MSSNFSSDFFNGHTPIALVAGGAGFIGSWVCEELLKRNVKVICIDNWQTGLKGNISHLSVNPHFVLQEKDITHDFTEDIKRVDYIFHLAGLGACLNGEDVSIETLEANSLGTKVLLKLALESGAKFLLGSTIDVYGVDLSSKSTNDYFGSTRKDEGEFSHHEAKRFAEALVSEYGKKNGLDVRIVRLIDVFGPRMNLSTNNFLSRLFKQALYHQPLEVSGDQKTDIYPVYVDDVVEGIIKAIFTSGTKSTIFTLAGAKTTVFGFAQQLNAQVGENSPIQFSSVTGDYTYKGDESLLTTGRNLISWTPRTSLEEAIKKTVIWLEYHKQKVPRELQEKRKEEEKFKENGIKPKLVEEQESTPKQKKDKVFFDDPSRISQPSGGGRKVVWVVLLLFALAMFVIFILPFVQTYIGVKQLSWAKESFTNASNKNSEKWSKNAVFWFRGARGGFLLWSNFPGLKNESKELAAKSKLLEQVANIGISTAVLNNKVQDLAQGIFGETTYSLSQTTEELNLEIKKLNEQLGFLEADMEENNIVMQAPIFKSIKLTTDIDIGLLKEIGSNVSQIIPELSSLLGEKERKTYLILLQDNTQQRPAGGRIGAYALLSFERGKLINTDVQRVAIADGQLKGLVEPPSPIKDYLGETNWYLKDSNWSPDFPTSAGRALWFIDKEIDEKADGVISIDLEFIKSYLAQNGKLELPEFNESVSADNLYEKVISHEEKNYFPGSQTRKDFLSSLLSSVITAYTKSPKGNTKTMITAITTLLNQRHIALWTSDRKINHILATSGWGSLLEEPTCQQSNSKVCVPDYVLIADANLGKNVSSYFVKRRSDLELEIAKEKITHRLTISYDNNSNSASGGEYKNYVRVYTQKESKLIQATAVNSATGEQEDLKVDLTKEKGKSVFGMYVPVQAGETKQLAVFWETPIKKITAEGELAFLWQKQMGELGGQASLRVSVEGVNRKILASSQGLVLGSMTSLKQVKQSTSNEVKELTTTDPIMYNTTLAKDFLARITWQPN